MIKLLDKNKTETVIINPFADTKVDSPFENHVDFNQVYSNQFNTFKLILHDIKCDKNNHSQGALLLGEAGTGKSHLIMRLGKELLKKNRLLYIRRPNNSEAIISHTYSYIWESLLQKIPGSDRTQLDFFLNHSFAHILALVQEKSTKPSKILNLIIQVFQKNDNLTLYDRLKKERPNTYSQDWDFIGRKITDWWKSKYSAGGYSNLIVDGLIKYCKYQEGRGKQDLIRRWLAGDSLDTDDAEKIGLKDWPDDLNKEEFSLEAIRVFGRLSLLDEPLILVFEQVEGLFDSERLIHPKNVLLLKSFGDTLKEIISYVPNTLVILNLFPDSWENNKHNLDNAIQDRLEKNKVILNNPDNEQILKILELKAQQQNINIYELFSPEEIRNIISPTVIRRVLNKASVYFNNKFYGIPLPESPLEMECNELKQIFKRFQHTTKSISKKLDLDFNTKIKDVNEIVDIIINLVEKVVVPEKRFLEDFNKIKHLQEKEYDYYHKISDFDELGKMKLILDGLGKLTEITFYKPLKFHGRVLPEHCIFKMNNQFFGFGFLNLMGNAFTHRIVNFIELTKSHQDVTFILFRDIREPQINPYTVGKQKINELNSYLVKNGKFIFIEKDDRIMFESIYQMLVDIEEKDFEIPTKDALSLTIKNFPSYWLFKDLGISNKI